MQRLTETSWGRAALWLLATIFLIGIAVSPAIYNGFPLVYDDTNVYISGIQIPQYPIFYTIFVRGLGDVINLEFVILAQACLTLYVIFFSLYYLSNANTVRLIFLSSTAILLFSQVPWLVSWLMPDLLGGLGSLCLITLLFSEKPVRRFDQAVLLFIALFSCLASTANVFVLLPFGAVCLIIRKLVLRRRLPAKSLTLAAAFAAVSISCPFASMLVCMGKLPWRWVLRRASSAS